MSMNLTRRLGVLALIGMALLGATASMQLLTDRQRVELAIEVLTPLESRLTAKGVSNLRNILTRLTTLKGQLTDPNNTGGIIQVPVDCQVVWTLTSVSAWFPETCDATEIQTQTLTYTGTIVVSPSDGGLPCPDLTKTETQTQTCTYVPLPPPLSGDSPLARNEHPRLGMTLADRPLIKARVSSGGEWHAAFQAYVNYLTHSDQWNTASSHQIWVSNLAAGAGLVYQTFEGGAPSGITFPAHADTQAEWGAKGAEWLLRVGVDPGVLGEYTRMLFLAYDWLHPALSPTQKATLIQAWKATMDAADDFQGSEAHYPAYTGFFYSNSNYSAFYSYWVMAGLAAKGDGIEEAWLQTGIDRYAWAFRNTEPNHRAQITRESQRAGIDGGALQGWYYAQVLMSRLAPMEMAYRTANGISVATHYGDLQNGGGTGTPPESVGRSFPSPASPQTRLRAIARFGFRLRTRVMSFRDSINARRTSRSGSSTTPGTSPTNRTSGSSLGSSRRKGLASPQRRWALLAIKPTKPASGNGALDGVNSTPLYRLSRFASARWPGRGKSRSTTAAWRCRWGRIAITISTAARRALRATSSRSSIRLERRSRRRMDSRTTSGPCGHMVKKPICCSSWPIAQPISTRFRCSAQPSRTALAISPWI
jgi:hypothetical protein